jgi:hypothetical protein
MVKYKTAIFSYDGLIKNVSIDKETDKSVWINGNRHLKSCEYEQFHDTWDDAKNYLLSKAESQLICARRELEKAQGYMGNVKGLKQ